MRIVQYHPRAASGDGGITNSVRRLSAGFARAGAQAVIVCDADAPPADGDGVEWRRLAHRRLGPVLVPPALEPAFADADAVILNSAWTAHNILAGGAARRLGVPYVLAPRGAYDPLIVRRNRLLKRLWWTAWERRLTARAAAIHVFFSSQAEHLRALGYRGGLIVAPNGVTAPEHPAWDGGTGGYLLYVGRFDPEHKGLDLLARAAASMPRGAIPPLRLHGPDWRGGKQRLVELVGQLGAADRIMIGDPVYGDRKWRLMAQASGFVYPSRWEGFGNAPAEAAALGVPTLVTPYPLGSYLAEQDAAVLADATVDGLADGLRRLVARGAAEVGRRARALIRDAFGWDSVARAWIDQLAAAM